MALDLTLVDKPSEPVSFTYGWKDAVLYALGVGAKKDELDYLYEGRGPKVLPSFAVVPMFDPMLAQLARTGADLAMVVHGSQRVRLHAALPAEGTLTTTCRVSGIYDMRKFAIIYLDCDVRDGAKLVAEAETRSTIISRNAGGFGGETPPKEPKFVELPKDRAPDWVVEEKTSPEQALLYRLSGDRNPLHADPEFAANVGFAQGPIFHGLGTYGFMVRHVVKGALGGDASKLTGFEAKFSKPVWPGDTLVTEGWNVEPGKIALSVKVKERDEVCCTGAWASTRV